jgi:hypothetical protein
MTYSKTYIGAITSILVGLTLVFKIEVPQDKLEVFVEVSAILIGPVLSMIGRYLVGNIHWTGLKK